MRGFGFKCVVLLYTFISYLFISELLRNTSKYLDDSLGSCRTMFIVMLFIVSWFAFYQIIEGSVDLNGQSALRPMFR